MENLILKSGFDNSNTDNDDTENIQIQIASLLTVFTTNAMKIAETYTLHSNRKIITSHDISRALKRELFTFLDDADLAQKAQVISEEFKKELEEYDEEYDEECDEECDDEDTLNITEETEEYCISTCDCSICLEVNKYNELWKTWQPTNNIEQILYDGIKKIDTQFNL